MGHLRHEVFAESPEGMASACLPEPAGICAPSILARGSVLPCRPRSPSQRSLLHHGACNGAHTHTPTTHLRAVPGTVHGATVPDLNRRPAHTVPISHGIAFVSRWAHLWFILVSHREPSLCGTQVTSCGEEPYGKDRWKPRVPRDGHRQTHTGSLHKDRYRPAWPSPQTLPRVCLICLQLKTDQKSNRYFLFQITTH